MRAYLRWSTLCMTFRQLFSSIVTPQNWNWHRIDFLYVSLRSHQRAIDERNSWWDFCNLISQRRIENKNKIKDPFVLLDSHFSSNESFIKNAMARDSIVGRLSKVAHVWSKSRFLGWWRFIGLMIRIACEYACLGRVSRNYYWKN